MNIFGLTGTDHTGRNGLSQVSVTPLVYLQLLHSLEKNIHVNLKKKRLHYNETQLKIAFSQYLRDNKGSWKSQDAFAMDRFQALATKLVEKDIETAQKQNQQDQKKNLAPKAADKKQQRLLQRLGLLPDNEEKLDFEDLPKESAAHLLLRYTLRAENVVEFLSVIGEPTATVAASLLFIAAESAVTDRVLEFLLERYEHDAHNAPEKKAIADVMHHKASDNFLQRSAEKIDHLISSEKEQGFKEKLHELKPVHDHAHEKRHLFAENQAMTGKQTLGGSATAAKIIRAGYPLQILSVPKPDFTDPAFGGSGKHTEK